MDPPENSVNRIGRTIWTVWGYLSGAVARYLRPEVTAEGNQSVHARTDETDLKSAVNKIEREVKTNNSNSENERAEVKCSSSEARVQVASVQWENTGVVKNDNNDELHVHTTKKQTYHCAAWSTETDTDSKGQTGDDPAEKEAVSSDEVQAEEVYANSESKEREVEVTGKTEQKDGDNEEKEECDRNHEVEKCDMTREAADNTDIMVQSEQDVEQDKQINMMDDGETEETGDLKHADEYRIDETEKQIIEQKDQRKTENDEDQGTESQVQDLLEYLTEEANSLSKPERLKAMEKYSDEIADVSKNEIEERMPETGSAAEQDEERETAQELEEIGRFEQKHGDSEERDQDREDEKCDMTREDLGNTDVMIQSELYGQQDKQINMMDDGETEDTGGFKHAFEHRIDETEKQIVEQKDQRKTENDEDQGTESRVQDLLEYLTEEANSLSKPERLKAVETYSDEIKFSKNSVEEMMSETEQDEDTTEREQDMTKYELMESVETLQRVSEEYAPNDETELKMTTVVDETIDALEDTLLSDSKQDTSENTPETGTGSTVLATETEAMFSDQIVFEFPGELRKGPETALADTDLGCFEEIKTQLQDPQTLAEREAVIAGCVEHSETLRAAETEQDTETVVQSFCATESQEIDKTEFSLKEHVEFRTELIVETTETKISSEDEEAEASETESQSPVIRNVSLQPHELLEFTEGQCESSQGTMDTFSETQGNANMSESTGAAEHVAEDQTDVKLVSTRSFSPTEFPEEPLDLQSESERCTDVEKTALEYVEKITNQVLKEMIETECNLVQKTEPLVGLSPEEPADAEHQAPAECVSADAPVLEEERKLLAETMDSVVEMEVETASSEAVKQNKQHISSLECETTEADGRHERMQKSIAGETVLRSHEDLMEVSRPVMKRGFDQVSTDLPEVKTEGTFDLILQAFENSSLDFTVQKSRIAVKNPLIRPPKDPRKLLFKASAEPLPQPSPRAQTVEVSAPSKGVIGFKLPGLGAGLPVLRKTEFGQKAREGEAERTLQPQPKSAAVTEDSVKQEQVPAKPKWTPPRHPGMGSPFMMAELQSKLKKPVQE